MLQTRFRAIPSGPHIKVLVWTGEVNSTKPQNGILVFTPPEWTHFKKILTHNKALTRALLEVKSYLKSSLAERVDLEGFCKECGSALDEPCEVLCSVGVLKDLLLTLAELSSSELGRVLVEE